MGMLLLASLVSPRTSCSVFFFFQAEDGIRDYKVTGVQTCALPIYRPRHGDRRRRAGDERGRGAHRRARRGTPHAAADGGDGSEEPQLRAERATDQNRRGACRGRGEISGGGGSFKKKKKKKKIS